MQKINLSEGLLKELYVEKKLTLKTIANDLGVSRQTVANKMNEYGIPIRNSEYIRQHKPKPKIKLRKKKRYRDKSTFEKVLNELKSIDRVADYFGINQKTAFEWKKRHGISISQHNSRKVSVPNNQKPYTNKEWLEDMYSKYSWEDLGAMLGVHPTTLSKWGVRFGIATRKPSAQWDLKDKFGNKVLHNGIIDLSAYKSVYVTGKKAHLSTKIKDAIIALYGECENPLCTETEVLDLHHIDENHSNNNFDNHAVLCPNCHARIHRLGVGFNTLVPNHIAWDKLQGYQEAK